jgi:hypothetical protein
MTSRNITKWSRKHDAMVDLVIARPSITTDEIAQHFGYSPSWITVIITSDRFKDKLADRREEVIDPVLMASLEEKIKAVTDKAVEIILAKLQKAPDKLSDQFVMRAAEFGAKSLGLGQKGNAPAAETEPDHLHDLAARLVSLNNASRAAGAEDVTYVENAQAGETGEAA